jgi:hypothetical protein
VVFQSFIIKVKNTTRARDENSSRKSIASVLFV